jgi:nitrate/TMAO reductase-like tetraheme cytochrome c subunit
MSGFTRLSSQPSLPEAERTLRRLSRRQSLAVYPLRPATTTMSRESGVQQSHTTEEDPKQRRPFARIATALAAVLAVLIVLAALVAYTPLESRLCATCHSMRPSVESWSESSHANFDCVKCHERPYRWYELPNRVSTRLTHISYELVVEMRSTVVTMPASLAGTVWEVSEPACLRCHELTRRVTTRGRVTIDHEWHARKNQSCISCHERVAHPAAGSQALAMMRLCYDCHGPEEGDATDACEACHPSGFQLEPVTHATAWKKKHGTAAKVERDDCLMCHHKSYCDDCHGVEMPHPSDWTAEKGGHGKTARGDRAVCARCHGDEKRLCEDCHHSGFPHDGPWATRHFKAVEESGPKSCLKCHGAMSYCNTCHVTGRVPKR